MKTSIEAKTNKKHRWHDVIVAWAEGKSIQYKSGEDSEWVTFIHSCIGYSGVPAFNSNSIQWRIKPKTVTKRYRMALVCLDFVNEVVTVDITYSCIDEPIEYDIEGFIRWLGDSVEVELEVNDGNE